MSRLAARMGWVAFLTLGFMLMALPAANAYLDPGTGSMIFQAVIAAAMAAGLTLKLFWRRITAFFRSDTSTSQDPEREPQETE